MEGELRIATAVVERDGKTYGVVVFGGKREYGPEDL